MPKWVQYIHTVILSLRENGGDTHKEDIQLISYMAWLNLHFVISLHWLQLKQYPLILGLKKLDHGPQHHLLPQMSDCHPAGECHAP